MASLTLTGLLGTYGSGTTVGAYKQSNWSQAALPPSGAPVGSSDASAAVASDGTLTLTGLTESTDYFLVQPSGGTYVYTRTRTGASGSAGTPDVDVASIAAGDTNIGNVDVASLPALPAGTNNLGDVDVLTLPALPAGTNNIGDVDLASAIPAGSNVIGKTDHTTTGIGSGRKIVTTAGTRVALASTTAAKWVTITAETDNTGYIVVGSAAGVIAALATREGTPLAAGDTITLPLDDLADVGLDSTVNGDGVSFTFGT